METTLTDQNFESEVTKSTLPVLVDFWAEWCGPCRIIGPVVLKLSKKYEGKLSVGKLNVDDYPQIAEKFQVRGIPNLKIFKNGKIVEEIVGAAPEADLVKSIEKHI